jgi:murein DD-endopeptidase MepM/ murein hydrolase activator NlpD
MDLLPVPCNKSRGEGIGIVGTVGLNNSQSESLRARLLNWFPDREFFMRSQGHVRFIKLSSRVQIAVASVVTAALVFWIVSMSAMAISQYVSRRDRNSLLEREAKVATAESRVKAYRKNLDKVTDDLERRQDFLDKVTSGIDGLPKADDENDTVSDSSTEAAKMVQKVSVAIPEAAGLAKVEARQLAFAERLTRWADHRAGRASAALKKLGLNPNKMLASAEDAQGGPLELLTTGRDGSIDPRFERLGLSVARMEALENSLGSIPQYMPADHYSISSYFGVRRDPFTGRAAMHPGLDLKGAYGAPIYAAGDGTVVFAGRKGGYGNAVEIDHGNGLMTIYGHMSATRAKIGQHVDAGTVIGAIGSTGRSTGPHLHFEVRLNGTAINPRPFLESAPHVLEEARAGTASGN